MADRYANDSQDDIDRALRELERRSWITVALCLAVVGAFVAYGLVIGWGV